MKKYVTMIALTFMVSLAGAQNGVTFVVDENLAPVKEKVSMRALLTSGDDALKKIFYEEGLPGDTRAMIAKSFADDEEFLAITGRDVFFKIVVRAYAEHRPLVLSPDMMWVLVSQGFARYVNAHPDQMRNQLVAHNGKMDLVVQSNKDLLSSDAEWEKLISDFTAQINDNTRGDIAKTITADFSTTGVTERIASQITLMETMKSYFDYVVHTLSCGIPTITLTGTPQDWQKVVEKTQQLEKYGVGDWTQNLIPILTEFVKASEGKANQVFWQGMVKKQRVDKLDGGGCIPGHPTELDGWILKFFPDENGHTLDQVPCTHKMPSERVYVDFKYQIVSPVDGTVFSETPLQLVAGFIGADVDLKTGAMKPKMGWVVRQMEGSDSIVKRLQKMDSGDGLFSGIELRVNKVPEHLAQLPYIKKLTLYFTNEVELPDWFYNLQIDNLTIYGEIKKVTEDAIWKSFPHAKINGKQGVEEQEPIVTVKPKAAPQALKVVKGEKPVMTIRGTVSDANGPLIGAGIEEVDEYNRPIERTVTDVNGYFTLGVTNKKHKIRVRYIGMETVKLKITKKKYRIVMQPKIDSFKGIDGNKGVMQEPRWRAIPLDTK
ncbi:CarboxypepD_reg-like domain-containing protein [Prevotella communis]|uniref:CarboxypepD_reg-like domain-containing protein n=1 Tax=Prevotella communis TaxID=2913614 RepID=A0A1G7W645_9BACT|nr:DUF4419 domain-containing protein [Prevotella communis]SDG67444.1 CarboxypepD_reg-like domain-containing protein [Prevotella communis]